MQGRSLLFHALAHAVAAGVVIALSLVLAFLAYFGLLAWAVLAGSPIGGPLGLVGLMLVSFVASIAAVLGVLFPVTVAADTICTRSLKWPRFFQIPVATVFCLAEVATLFAAIAWLRDTEMVVALKVAFFTWMLLLVPLGIYWWVLQFHQGARWVALRLWARFRDERSDASAQRPAV